MYVEKIIAWTKVIESGGIFVAINLRTVYTCVYLFPCRIVSKSRYIILPLEWTVIINMLNKTRLLQMNALMVLVIG